MVTLTRFSALILLLAAAACGGAACGGGTQSSGTPSQPVEIDAVTAELWRGWAEGARNIAVLLGRMYGSTGLLPDRTEELQQQAQTLAKEIRSESPEHEAVARLAEDLNEVAEDLEFGLQYSRNAGLPVIKVAVPGLEASLNQLFLDAEAVGHLVESR